MRHTFHPAARGSRRAATAAVALLALLAAVGLATAPELPASAAAPDTTDVRSPGESSVATVKASHIVDGYNSLSDSLALPFGRCYTGCGDIAAQNALNLDGTLNTSIIVPTYCINIDDQAQANAVYDASSWSDNTDPGFTAHSREIMWILQQGPKVTGPNTGTLSTHPALAGLPLGQQAEAMQQAIWNLTNPNNVAPGQTITYNFVLPYNSPGVEDATTRAIDVGMSALLDAAKAQATVLPTEPGPALAITPTTHSGAVGSRIGPFSLTVHGTGAVADLSSDDPLATLQNAGGSTITTGVDGDDIYLVTPAGDTSTSATITATSTTATVPLGTVLLGRVSNTDLTQPYIVAQDTAVPSHASATVTLRQAGTGTSGPAGPTTSSVTPAATGPIVALAATGLANSALLPWFGAGALLLIFSGAALTVFAIRRNRRARADRFPMA